MRANFSTRLQKHIRSTVTDAGAAAYGLLSTTRSRTHAAIKSAARAVERFGYFLTVVRDAGDLISCKLYGPKVKRDYMKNPEEYIKAAGYPINLQFSLTDAKGMTVYSYRHNAGTIAIVTSKKPKDIEDAIYAELESEIKKGVDFVKPRA